MEGNDRGLSVCKSSWHAGESSNPLPQTVLRPMYRILQKEPIRESHDISSSIHYIPGSEVSENEAM